MSADEPTEADPALLRPGQRIRHRDGDEYILVERKTGSHAEPLPGWWLRQVGHEYQVGLADANWESGEWSLVDGQPTPGRFVDGGTTTFHNWTPDGRPTDEPTEAEPRLDVAELREAVAAYEGKTGTGPDDWHDPHDAEQFLANSVDGLLDEIDRLRALVGGRPAAPTREQVVAVIEDHIHWGNQYLDPDVADAVVALLSRSAAEPPEIDREQLLAQIEERRGDEAFMRRLRARIYRDRPLLDRLGGVAAEPNEEAGDGA